MKAQCPTCNSPLDLESLIEDGCGRSCFALIAKQPTIVQGQLIPYLQLFKPRLQGLRWSRAQFILQTLIDETKQVESNTLTAALSESVLQLSEQRRGDNWRPLSSHNYLKRVIESQQSQQKLIVNVNKCNHSSKPASKTAQAVNFLAEYTGSSDIPDWFVREICYGLQALYLACIDGTPAADIIEMTAERWITECWPRRPWEQNHHNWGQRILASAFRQCANSAQRWPAITDILGRVPPVD